MIKYDSTEKMSIKPRPIPDNCCRRMIIIDGTNVVYGSKTKRVFGKSLDETKIFNAAGLLLVVYELLCQRYEVLVTLKHHFQQDITVQNGFIFDELEDMEILTYIPGDKANKSLDDEVLLYWADQYKAAVVSRDTFKEYGEKWPGPISRRVEFTFKPSKSIDIESFHLPENRFNFTRLTFDNSEVALCHEDNPDFDEVKSMYRQIHPNYFPSRIRKIEMIFDYIQLISCIICNTKKLPELDYLNVNSVAIDLKFKKFREMCKWRYEEGKKYEYNE